MFKTQVEPVGIRCIFVSCDLLSMICVLTSGHVCVFFGGGRGLSTEGMDIFLRKRKTFGFKII